MSNTTGPEPLEPTLPLPPTDGPVSDAQPISVELPEELEYFRSSEAYRVDLEGFHGPLDLLLYLIQKDELDIYDIPIAHITEQYLAYVEIMENLSLDVAGEFIVMAATLMRIKTRLLLPVQAEDEELDENDPRAELVRRLLEYKRYREMAENLRRLEEERTRLHVRSVRPAGLDENEEEPELRVGLFDLLNALSGVFDRVTKEAVHNVHREAYTVEEKVELIRLRLRNEGTIRFDEFFRDDAIKMEVVVTFVAILELAKRQEIRLMQTEALGMIWVTHYDADPKAAAAIAGGGGTPS